MAQRRAGLPVRTGTRIQQTKSSMKGGETDMEEGIERLLHLPYNR